MNINYYRYPHPHNVGDTLTPKILKHFLPDDWRFRQTIESRSKKLIAVGSIMRTVMPGDVVWGTGVMNSIDRFPHAKDATFLAVRGQLSRTMLMRNGAEVPEVYGDPGLLLPLMYNPDIEVTHEIGIIPHFVDAYKLNKIKVRKMLGGHRYKVINVFDEWHKFVDEVKSCERIISSSLHGIVIAEAYGKPAEWIKLSNRVCGNGFKFYDYLTGTGRPQQKPGQFPVLEQSALTDIQDGLIEALLNYYEKASGQTIERPEAALPSIG